MIIVSIFFLNFFEANFISSSITQFWKLLLIRFCFKLLNSLYEEQIILIMLLTFFYSPYFIFVKTFTFVIKKINFCLHMFLSYSEIIKL